jgi:hypothetical protein
MPEPPSVPPPGRKETRFAIALFAACLVFHFWGVRVGWQSKNLPGVEYRQAQTAISAYFIRLEDDFSLAYPTPVFGKPWSIPMEFPLYQWIVVLVGKLTGYGLTKAGRTVSIACFYLMLPAVFLLLARWRVAPGRRWLVLAVIVTCPLYIFYARAFLIETMVLMFALWFWVAFERAVAGRHWGWLALAILAGTGAGLVKVTTFLLFLLPAGLWALQRLWSERNNGRWRVELAWMAGAVVIPFAATLWWVRFADAVKARNPLGRFLVSAHMTEFNFGSWALRSSPELWMMQWRIVAAQLTWLPVLLGCAGLALIDGRPRWREILLCLAMFLAALVTFPILYAYHDYYYLSNTVFLLIAMGLVLVALAESRRPRWLVALVVLTVVGLQAGRYLNWYYPTQSAISAGGSGLTEALQALTRPDEVLVIAGQDWSSITPYYAQRRAVMLRGDVEDTPEQMAAAFSALKGEKLGALVITGPLTGRASLIARVARLGLDPWPLLLWRDTTVFLTAARHAENVQHLQAHAYREVAFAPGAEPPPERLANAWHELSGLTPAQRTPFQAMHPAPVRFFSTYGLNWDGRQGQAFGAHPVTRLVFALSTGRHSLRTTVMLPLDAYRSDLPDDQASDGVEIALAALSPDGGRRILHTQLFDPRHHPEDRGLRALQVDFELGEPGEVELFFGPGPDNRDTRDWIRMGRLEIK